MDFTVAIILYLILLAVLLVVTREIGINTFSAITVSMVLAGILLIILVPPNELDKYIDNMVDGHEKCDNTVGAWIIAGIYILTIFVIVWYVLCKAYEDVDSKYLC